MPEASQIPESSHAEGHSDGHARPPLGGQAILLGGLLAFVALVFLIDRVRGGVVVVGPLAAIPLALIPAIS